jgi:hypothetical protein
VKGEGKNRVEFSPGAALASPGDGAGANNRSPLFFTGMPGETKK